MWEVLAPAFAACLVLTGIHCYLGIHVVMRGVIFVDLALAQIAALGTAAATLLHFDIHSPEAYACSLLFTFFGAAVFAIGRFKDRRVPQEAIIGIVFAVSSAVAILIISQSPVESDEIESMLVGHLLYTDWFDVLKTLLIYSGVAALHYALRGRFFAISKSVDAAHAAGLKVRLWDLIFYMSFGLVVTSSVQLAGVLLVFSFLIVPAVCAMMFFNSIARRLMAGWGFGLLGSTGGLAASAKWDLPTGAAVVATFGVLLIGCALVFWVSHRKQPVKASLPA